MEVSASVNRTWLTLCQVSLSMTKTVRMVAENPVHSFTSSALFIAREKTLTTTRTHCLEEAGASVWPLQREHTSWCFENVA